MSSARLDTYRDTSDLADAERVSTCLKCGVGARLPDGHHVGDCHHKPDTCHICRPSLRYVASSVGDQLLLPRGRR